MNIQERKEDVLKRLKAFDSWEDRYRQIIAYGKKLAPYPPEQKDANHLVPGCLSQVYLTWQKHNGRLHFYADSDSAIAKGIMGVLLSVYSNATPEEILGLSPEFLREVGITQHLSMNRRNGLTAMTKLLFAAAEASANE